MSKEISSILDLPLVKPRELMHMHWKFAVIASLIAIAILSSPQRSSAQEDETYDFDGVADMDPQPADPTDWMTSENWSDSGADPLPPLGQRFPILELELRFRPLLLASMHLSSVLGILLKHSNYVLLVSAAKVY